MSETKKPTNLQIFLFFIGFVTLFTLVFVLGVVVGKGLSTRGQVEVAKKVEEQNSQDIELSKDSEPEINGNNIESEDEAAKQEEKKVENVVKKGVDEAQKEKEIEKEEVTKKETPVKEVAKVNNEEEKPTSENNLGYEKKPERPKAIGNTFPPTDPGGKFTVQVGSFKEKQGAEKILNSYRLKGYPAYMSTVQDAQNQSWYRIKIGTFSKRDTAKEYFEVLKKKEKDINGFITVNN